MAKIRVSTPNGVQIVEIAGDSPTPEEQAAIIDFFKLGGGEPTDQLEPLEAEREETETTPDLSPEGIDYESGVRSSNFRFQVARGDNPREKRKQLLALGIPEAGFFQDQQGDFILDLDKIPEDIKRQYDLKSEKGKTKLAIDEEGLSWSDVIDFGGEAGTPILFGTAAALATTGVGIPVAAALVGGASALGYVADEAIEYAEGVRDQTLGEDAKNLFFEFAMGFGGEVAGRYIAKGLGRLIKGPGGQEANAARESVRGILDGEVDATTGELVKGRPTLRATNMAPLLGRAQAFFEGVFPNAKVATDNAKYMQAAYQRFLSEAGIPEGQAQKTSEEFLNALTRDIERMYSSPEQLAKDANKRLKDTVQREIDSLIDNFGDTSFAGGEAARKAVETSKRIFDEDVDLLYSKADEILKGEKIINTKGLTRTLTKIASENKVSGKAIQESAIGRVIQGLEDFETVSNINGIRTALREASWDPSLIGSQDKRLLTNLLSKVDESLINAETSLLSSNQRLNGTVLPVGTSVDPKTGRIVSRAKTESQKAQIQLQKTGLKALRDANEYYKNGISKFNTLFAEKLIASSRAGGQKGGQLVDPEAILDEVILPDRPKLLQDLLNATRPSPMTGLAGRPGFPIREAPESFLDIVPDVNVKAPDGRSVNLRQTIAENPNDDLATFYKKRFASQRELADEVAQARLQGTSYKDSVRNSLARRWMERTLNNPDTTNIFGRTDPLRVVQQIRALGQTGRVLFGKQYDPIMKSLGDLSLLGEEVTEQELRSLAGRPITEQIEALSRYTDQLKDLKGIPFLRSLETAARSGEIDKVLSLVTRNEDTIRQANKFLGADSEVMNDVRDQLMAKILGSLGDSSSEIVSKGRSGKLERTVSKEFVQEVMSGKKHDQILKAIDSIGRNKIELLLGKEFVENTIKLAQKAEAVSMRPIAGLGGLETANLARSLTLGAAFFEPIKVLSTVLGLRTMGRLLRNNSYLKMMARPTGDESTAKSLEQALTVAWGASTRVPVQAIQKSADENRRTIERKTNNVNDLTSRIMTKTPSKPIPVQRSVRPTYQRPDYKPSASSRRIDTRLLEQEIDKLYGLRQ
tara:strand:- start:697 stop:3975 length:3279 start_codon:yes stop_codon:yes gene_type:complete